MTDPGELYACLLVREFPAQALLRLRPELRERPCVVLEGLPPLQQVCSLNTRARLRGIEHGMTATEVATFSDAVVLERSTEMERVVSDVLVECAGAFSPRIEPRREGTAWLCGLDIAGTERLLGTPEKLAADLRERVRRLAISAQVAVSRNFLTALCVARGLPANIAVRVIAPGREAVALSALPIAVLQIEERHAEIFAAWGIATLGMLAALPEDALVARIGQAGRRLRLLACGESEHLLEPQETPFVLEERADLDAPLEELEPLLFGLSAMLEQLVVRAQSRLVALASVTVTLRLEGGGEHTRIVNPRVPGSDRRLWLKLLQLELEAHPPPAPITGVTLHAEPGIAGKVQLGLFSPQAPEPGRLDVTLARIAALVGEANVGRIVLEDTHAPEGFHLEPFRVLPEKSLQRELPAARMSLRRLRPPERSAVVFTEGRPRSLTFRERRYIVEQAYGPWLAGGVWWSDETWGQRQWDLVARSGDGAQLCCCVTHDFMEAGWKVTALYD
ncbi:DNA polymerase Y family protein [Silvibacterium sp.]|uniref:DNA polymerase Y family protein n=1 Tax=Silvibacterium sp. TaxID=1964179 RepID=UPI0039E506C5